MPRRWCYVNPKYNLGIIFIVYKAQHQFYNSILTGSLKKKNDFSKYPFEERTSSFSCKCWKWNVRQYPDIVPTVTLNGKMEGELISNK